MNRRGRLAGLCRLIGSVSLALLRSFLCMLVMNSIILVKYLRIANCGLMGGCLGYAVGLLGSYNTMSVAITLVISVGFLLGLGCLCK